MKYFLKKGMIQYNCIYYTNKEKEECVFMKKNILTVIIAMMLSLALAACSSPAPAETPAGGEKAPATTEASKEAETKAPAETQAPAVAEISGMMDGQFTLTNAVGYGGNMTVVTTFKDGKIINAIARIVNEVVIIPQTLVMAYGRVLLPRSADHLAYICFTDVVDGALYKPNPIGKIVNFMSIYVFVNQIFGRVRQPWTYPIEDGFLKIMWQYSASVSGGWLLII